MMLFFLRVSAIKDRDFLFRVVIILPLRILIFFIELHNEKRMLEVNEEVAHVRHLLGLLLVRDHVKCRIAILVVTINLFFKLLLRETVWDVLDTQVRPEILTLLD